MKKVSLLTEVHTPINRGLPLLIGVCRTPSIGGQVSSSQDCTCIYFWWEGIRLDIISAFQIRYAWNIWDLYFGFLA